MWPNPQYTGDLDTFTEETLNGKLNSLCSVHTLKKYDNHYKSCFLALDQERRYYYQIGKPTAKFEATTT